MQVLKKIYEWFFQATNKERESKVITAIENGNHTSLNIVDFTGMSLGRVYVTLNRLEMSDLIYSEWDEDSATLNRAGCRRKLYYLVFN